MADQHPAQFPGMLPPFPLTEGAAPTTLQASNPIPAVPPADTIPRAGGAISQDPALQTAVNSKFQGYGTTYDTTKPTYFQHGHPDQFLGVAMPSHTSSPFVGPVPYMSQTLHASYAKSTEDSQADLDDDIIPPETIHQINKAPDDSPPGSATNTAQTEPKVYSRIPLTEAERALKGSALKALIRNRYGPEDREGDPYPYTRLEDVRTDSKGRKGDVRFKVLQLGVEQLESKTSFEKRMSEQAKQKKEAEDAVAAERKKEATKRMLDSIKESATAGKRRKVKKEKDGRDTKPIRVKT